MVKSLLTGNVGAHFFAKNHRQALSLVIKFKKNARKWGNIVENAQLRTALSGLPKEKLVEIMDNLFHGPEIKNLVQLNSKTEGQEWGDRRISDVLELSQRSKQFIVNNLVDLSQKDPWFNGILTVKYAQGNGENILKQAASIMESLVKGNPEVGIVEKMEVLNRCIEERMAIHDYMTAIMVAREIVIRFARKRSDFEASDYEQIKDKMFGYMEACFTSAKKKESYFVRLCQAVAPTLLRDTKRYVDLEPKLRELLLHLDHLTTK